MMAVEIVVPIVEADLMMVLQAGLEVLDMVVDNQAADFQVVRPETRDLVAVVAMEVEEEEVVDITTTGITLKSDVT